MATKATAHKGPPTRDPRPAYLKTLRAGDPDDQLRALLLEMLTEAGISNNEVARQHRVAFGSSLDATAVLRFRTDEPAAGTPPSKKIQEAVALVTATSVDDNWLEAMRRFEDLLTQAAARSLPPTSRPRSAPRQPRPRHR